MSRPPSGSMVYWRFKTNAPGAWRFGYVTYAGGCDMLRMGAWNGDNMGGSVVSAPEIEWRHYER
jgi:hypothetical protein